MKGEQIEELARAITMVLCEQHEDCKSLPDAIRIGAVSIIDRWVSEALESEQNALRNILALARKRQAEGGPDGNYAAIEGFALAGLKGSNHA